MTDQIYTQDGKILVEDGKLKCGCCGSIVDPRPPWVCPDCPDWGGPGGPRPPINPNGDPRCCAGDTICSANDDEPILLGVRLNGSISAQYTHSGGAFPGVQRSYSASWNQTFVKLSTPGACDESLAGLTSVTVPYWSRNATFPVDVVIGIGFNNLKWDRTRGFFGEDSDTGDDPVLNSSSGINVNVGQGGGATGGAIRGTNNAGYFLANRFCRSDSPLLPIVTRPDTFRFSQFPSFPIDEGVTGDTTTPKNICLNEVVFEYTNQFSFASGGNINVFNITSRLYCFVSGVAPCLTA